MMTLVSKVNLEAKLCRGWLVAQRMLLQDSKNLGWHGKGTTVSCVLANALLSAKVLSFPIGEWDIKCLR